MRVAVVVPVKAFAHAKQRLAGVLDDAQRHDLAQWCAQRVLVAAAPFERFVVCDDDDVREWALAADATPIWSPGTGLNLAITTSIVELRDRGFDVALVAHGDLPLAERLDHVVTEGAVCAVPDHRYDGTNVLSVPTALADTFRFQYGKGSFPRHVREALRCGRTARVVRDKALAHDLDTPSDLDDPRMEEVRQWLRTSRANHR